MWGRLRARTVSLGMKKNLSETVKFRISAELKKQLEQLRDGKLFHGSAELNPDSLCDGHGRKIYAED